ncbi:hypothetical protein JCM33374_g5134 [Metschnikowia sp. JCM 33374]|nr:hypothetical protein JCM33374_g5134 [Metschnikowia sp. JCM 33374]
MPYQLLILPKSWFVSDVHPDKFRVLSHIVNKGYSKPMAQYGIITSPRIKDPAHFLESLSLGPETSEEGAKEKDYSIMLLLGSKADYNHLEATSGYRRIFNKEVWPLSGCRDSDIPSELSGEFGSLCEKTVEHVVLGPTDPVDSDIADRVLATIGFKSYGDDGTFQDKDVSPTTCHYEITAFTSFRRGIGTRLIEYCVDEFFRSPHATLLKPQHVETAVLHAIVITQHDLVPFYQNKCGFAPSTHPDVWINVRGTDSPLEDGITATRDFSVSFMRRDIYVG